MRNRSIPAKKELPIQTFTKIQQLFAEKSWPLDGFLDEGYFDKFCLMMQELSEEQQEMLLALSQDFVWVQDMEYLKYFVIVFDLLINQLDANVRRTIVITPLLPPEDFGKPKSSVALFYQIKSSIFHIQKKYSSHNICLLESPSTFDESNFSPDTIFCLVDDFIGSGETAIAATQFFPDRKIPTNNIFVLGLVAMQQGVDCLIQNSIQVFSGKIMQKAISERSDGKKDTYCDLMEAIEVKIKVRDEYKFGYAHSEGLVKMMRTPNNTFPIYWLKNKKNQNPPFPR